MIANCLGCNYEFKEAYEYQQNGLFLASSLDKEVNIGCKKHFSLWMVDEDGVEVVR